MTLIHNLHNFPDVLRIEASGKCNFKCIHCPNGYVSSPRGIMQDNIFELLTSQLASASFIPRVVVLYHGGEPLLNKNISTYIRYFKKLGTKKIKVVTNGSLLDERVAVELDTSGLDELWISFDGHSPQENDYIRRGGNFSRDCENTIKALSIKNRKMRIVVTNVQILTKNDVDLYLSGKFHLETPKYILKIFGNYDNIHFESYPAMTWPALKSSNILERLSIPSETIPNYCSNLFETFTVLSNGNIAPCCHDLTGEVCFGNILKDNIFDVWNGQKHTDFRNAIINKKPKSICKKCIILFNEYLIRSESYSCDVK